MSEFILEADHLRKEFGGLVAVAGVSLRVRAVDARGIEGRDAVFEFRLKARPEPPIQSAPAFRKSAMYSSMRISDNRAWPVRPAGSAGSPA